MSDYITVNNLDNIVAQNKQIKDEIEFILTNLNSQNNVGKNIKSEEKFSLNVLKQHGLIQIPVDNKHWGGAIYYVEGKKVPIINTALPRIYQYFVAWHELYHLLNEKNQEQKVREVSTDLKVEERKADYFAACALMGNVYEYYNQLKQTEFFERIALCMDLFQVPYKAILIQLYEEALEKNNDELVQLILEYFDVKRVDWKAIFQKLGLDEELIEPSYVINVAYLEEKIKEKIHDEGDVTVHEMNRRFLEELKERMKIICTEV